MDKESNQCKGKCGCEKEKNVNLIFGIIIGFLLGVACAVLFMPL
jgi:hypothetical protein